MNPAALERFLRDRIPITQAMDVRVVTAGAGEVALEAPLEANINVHGTMFGGSVATLGLLAAWSVLHLRLEEEGLANQLVIHKTAVDYLLPVKGEAQAVARVDEERWQAFRHVFDRRGRARVSVTAEVFYEGQPAGRLAGQFVAIAADLHPTVIRA